MNQRLNNTREKGAPRPREQKPVTSFVAFGEYAPQADADGYFLRHLAPTTYYCRSVVIFVDNTTGGRVRFRVNDDEYVERDLAQGMNTLQVERIVPGGTRIRAQLIDGTSAMGIWTAWMGEVNA